MTQDAIDLLVHPVAVHEKRVAMEVRVVQVHFIALCHHMPPHPVASPHHSQNCCPYDILCQECRGVTAHLS